MCERFHPHKLPEAGNESRAQTSRPTNLHGIGSKMTKNQSSDTKLSALGKIHLGKRGNQTHSAKTLAAAHHPHQVF